MSPASPAIERRQQRLARAAVALLVVAPFAVAWLLVTAGPLDALMVALVLLALAFTAGKAALAPDVRAAAMPEHAAPPPRHPFLVMNLRSGGGKVSRLRLAERAEALGAEVVVLDGSDVDVDEVARAALARGADLLGVAGGDGTMARVAGVAADHDVPFLVVSAGTRNHFALDLGLSRHDPVSCLAALGEDAVELRVDLGRVAGRTFVNNASFGAYALAVQMPTYRDDKARTALAVLPDALGIGDGPTLTARAGDLVVEHPLAVLVSDNPYGIDGRRPRLDTGRLGLVAVTVDNAGEAVELLRHPHGHGLTAAEVPEVVVTADAPLIPVGVDGEAVMAPTPVRCTIRPGALRVRVPRDRPGVSSRGPAWSAKRLRQLASPGRDEGGEHGRTTPPRGRT